MVEIRNMFGTLGNRIDNLPLSGSLGLLATGASLLEGQPVGQAVQAGLGTYQGLAGIEEDRKRKEMLQKLISEGGFTKQEQALIAASNNPAGTAIQIRNQKQARSDAAAARAANRKPTLQEQIDERLAVGRAQGLTGEALQRFSLTGKVPASARTPDDIFTDAKLAGYTDAEAALTRIDPDYVPPRFKKPDTPSTYKALQLRAKDAGLEAGSPEYAEFMLNNGKFKDTAGSDRFQTKGSYRLSDGTVIGDVTFDKSTGEYSYGTGKDKTVINIATAQPLTDSYFNIGIPNNSQFMKLRNEVKDDQTSLKRYQSYLKNIDEAGVGLQRLGDQMSSYFKTLFSTNAKKANLTERELALLIAQGELQGLIGRSRIETVGGGVMTEQDALRIIKNLGGDVNLLQNPEVVRGQISRLFEDKYKSYDDKLRAYNTAIDQRYSSLGYNKLNPIQIDDSLLDPNVAENLGLTSPSETNTEPSSTTQTIDLKDFNVSEINTYTNNELLGVLDKAAEDSKEAIAIVQELRLRGLIK